MCSQVSAVREKGQIGYGSAEPFPSMGLGFLEGEGLSILLWPEPTQVGKVKALGLSWGLL